MKPLEQQQPISAMGAKHLPREIAGEVVIFLDCISIRNAGNDTPVQGHLSAGIRIG